MKKNNKGFSLVELIIVIAIMAILAGALAPALIKYINKSRRSSDISNADTIRTAFQTALSNESAFNAINNSAQTSTCTAEGLKTAYGKFGSEFKSIVGDTTLQTKYYSKGKDFKVTWDLNSNTVTVTDDAGTELSPKTPTDD